MAKKKQRNKALLVTATACAIGFSGLGGATSAFAAVDPNAPQYTDYKNENMNDSDRAGLDSLKKWNSYGSTSSVIRDIHVVGEPTIEDAGSETLSNAESPTEQKLATPSTKITVKDSVTTTDAVEDALEVGLAAEFGSKAGVGVAETTQKLTASIKNTFKMTHTKANLHEDTKEYTIPSQSITVPAGKTYKIEYVYKKTALAGTIDEVKEITKGSGGLYNTPAVTVASIDSYQIPGTAGPEEQDRLRAANTVNDSIYNATPYQFYNHLVNMNKQAEAKNIKNTKFLITEGSGEHAFEISSKALLSSLYLDHNLKKVYMVDKNVPFTATASGHEFILKVTDVTNGVNKLVSQAPINNVNPN